MKPFSDILNNDLALENSNPEEPKKDPITPTDTSTATEDFHSGSPKQEEGPVGNQQIIYPIPVQVQEKPTGGFQFNILMNNVQHPKSQISVQQLLASATPEDTIILNISEMNGLLYSTLALASMMKSCRAQTITIFSAIDSIESLILWLSGKERRVTDLPFMTLSTLNYGTQGAVPDQVVDSQNAALMQGELLNEIVEAGIMTMEEATNFQKKEDVFVKFGDELKERLQKALGVNSK